MTGSSDPVQVVLLQAHQVYAQADLLASQLQDLVRQTRDYISDRKEVGRSALAASSLNGPLQEELHLDRL